MGAWTSLQVAVLEVFLISVWVGGFVLPPLAAILLLLGKRKTSLFLFGVTLYCYYGPTPPKALVKKFQDFINRTSPHAFRKVTTTFEEEISSSAYNGEKPVMLSYHPHGTFSWSYFFHGGLHPKLHPLVGLIAEALSNQPLFHFFFVRCFKCVGSASKKGMTDRMKARKSFGIIPGGFHESTISMQGEDRVYLKKRQGFIKYALQYGYEVVPVYTFGESDAYWGPSAGISWRHKLNDWSLPAILPWGKWWCPLLPRYDLDMHTVFGKAIPFPKIDTPSKEDVDTWHQKYIGELQSLFDRHKKWASPRGEAAKLDVW